MFYRDYEKLEIGFCKIREKYPDIDRYIVKLDTSDLTKINCEIRSMECDNGNNDNNIIH
jgi:hypothetical protein